MACRLCSKHLPKNISAQIDERDAIHSRFIEVLNLRVELMQDGKTLMVIPMHPDLLNSNQMVHGGVIATLADCAAAAAVRTVLPEDIFTPTIDLHINYLAPARRAQGDLYGHGKVISKGKSIAHAQAEIRQGDVAVANAVGVFRILQHKS